MAIGLSVWTGTRGIWPALHQVLQQEKKLLGALYCERRHNHAAAALDGRANKSRQFRPGIIMGMRPVAVGALHHQQIAALALGGAGMDHASWGDVVVAHASNVSGKQKLLPGPVGGQSDLSHA